MEESVVKLTALTGKGWCSTEVEMVRLSSYPCLAQCMGRYRQIDRTVLYFLQVDRCDSGSFHYDST